MRVNLDQDKARLQDRHTVAASGSVQITPIHAVVSCWVHGDDFFVRVFHGVGHGRDYGSRLHNEITGCRYIKAWTYLAKGSELKNFNIFTSVFTFSATIGQKSTAVTAYHRAE